MIPLTKKQSEVIEFIESFVEDKRYSPSFQEIADGLKLKSLATVHKHIHNLKIKGCLKQSPKKKRSIEVVEEPIIQQRFEMQDNQYLWDNKLKCYWVKYSGGIK